MMYHDFFDSERKTDAVEVNEETLEEVAGGKRVLATGNVKVRTGPGVGFDVIGHMDRGAILTYAGATETDERGVKWYCVSFGVNCGWVSSRYSRKV